MNGFIRGTDSNNSISEYLSYSVEDGYTVLKEGWYFVQMSVEQQATASGGEATLIDFVMNGHKQGTVGAWTGTSDWGSDFNSFPIYLKKGDKIYFYLYTTDRRAVNWRRANCYCYPMF